MTRILLRSAKDPFEVISPELSLALYPSGVFGRNPGNLVFSDAMHRLLSVPGSEVVSNSYLSERPGIDKRYIDRINSEFDHFVIPLANAFRTKFLSNLQRLTSVVEQLRIPVTVVGVGVAGGVGSLENPLPEASPVLNRAVRRFVSAVLDRSASIGVRGEFSHEYLTRLGFADDRVDIIGCPSLFRNGGTVDVVKRVPELSAESRFTVNISPYVQYMSRVAAWNAEKYRNLVYIPQADDSLELMLWGTNPPRVKNRDLPSHTDHILYRENRMRFFVDSYTWIEYLREQEFSFGTRIHGNIVALMAGTPAHVLVHDARTLELARSHEVPHTFVPELERKGPVDAAELFARSDFTAFNTGQADRFASFAAFLERNGLEHVYQPGKENPDYDGRLAQTKFPPPVETLYSDNREAKDALVTRVGNLYRKAGVRTLRRQHTPHYPVPHSAPQRENRVTRTLKGAARRAPVVARLLMRARRLVTGPSQTRR